MPELMAGGHEIRVDWRAGLLSMAFVVDVAKLSRLGGDLLEPLVFAAVVQANQAALRADPELDRRFAGSGETLPDELRRPISIHAVAQSLQLPFETVRRRVLRLAREDFLLMTPAGVYAPAAAIASPRHAAIQAARLERLARFHEDLAATGFLAPEEVSPRRLPPPALARSANRFLSQYMLRASQRTVALTGGVMEGFVFLGLCWANTGHLAHASEAPEPWFGAARPCSGVGLARSLDIPRETARRYLLELGRAGFARGKGRTWFAAIPPGGEARLLTLAAENEADLRRLFVRLREISETAGP